MNEQEYICKAVGLADGWSTDSTGVSMMIPGVGWTILHRDSELFTTVKDALAAQLVRQVDASLPKTHTYVHVYNGSTLIKRVVFGRKRDAVVTEIKGPDRTMNTIRAIVDSGVLEP